MNLLKKHFLLLAVIVVTSIQFANATHYRAGEILYELIGNYKYRVTIITYAKWSFPSNLADKDTVLIYWGDGYAETLARNNGTDADGNGIPDGEMVGNDIRKNVYSGIHTYPGAPPPPYRFYRVQFMDLNRIDGIINFDNGNSVDIPFYVEDSLKYPTDLANIGFNSSPVLTNPPIDYANLFDTFVHNPGAYDPDGDSMDFQLVPCKRNLNGDVVYNFSYPDNYCISQGFPANTLTIDRHTGQVVWATPCRVGIFNIAILVTEYRNGVNIGTLLRDMQIIVDYQPNNPPQLVTAPDTCIRAGDTLRIRISGTDPEPNQTVTLTAAGGPLQLSASPATFEQTNVSPPPAYGIFDWKTTCSHIQKEPYLVVFKAEDSYNIPLTDLEAWRITVIAPPPKNLSAVATNHNVTLTWDNPYLCASSPDFRGFSVWRKSGCDLFDPEYCETGLAGRGFTKISGANIFTYSFIDNTPVIGQQYTYRIVAHFSKLSPNGLFQFGANESVPSNGVCVLLPIDIPAIINVDVQQTDVSNGKIFVRWTKPLAGGNNLDTTQNPPPYRFDLYRGNGFSFSNPILIHTTPDAASFSLLTDTFYTDQVLNTTDSAWSYRVMFYANNDTVGTTAMASSVYLNVLPSDQSLALNWQEQVPWTNDSFVIFKLNKLTSVFEPLDTTYNHFYSDTGLINDSTYCYFVRAFGHYSLSSFPQPLINHSQEDCAIPVDTVPPCPPVLSLKNDCDLYSGKPWSNPQLINYLTWSNSYNGCPDDINHYNIYYGEDSAHLALIDSVSPKDDTTFHHLLNESLAGCYAIKAVDRVGNQSAFSNIFCVDNCPYYVLPNTFTPNGDGQNDIFHPFMPYRFVPKIEIKIYNRWGEQVFSTEDPDINWNGKVNNTGKECTEGVYVYAGYYYELHQSGLVKQPISGQKKGGGFIHLIRGK